MRPRLLRDQDMRGCPDITIRWGLATTGVPGIGRHVRIEERTGQVRDTTDIAITRAIGVGSCPTLL